LRRLTLELSGRRRWDARPELAKMYRVPPTRAWWPAVGAPLERRVRRSPPTYVRWQRTDAGVAATGRRATRAVRAVEVTSGGGEPAAARHDKTAGPCTRRRDFRGGWRAPVCEHHGPSNRLDADRHAAPNVRGKRLPTV
jgi:hypothetical protein